MPVPNLSVVALPVPPFVRHALTSSGVYSLSDIRGMSQAALMEVTGLGPEHAAEVLQLALQQAAPGWRLSGAIAAGDLLAQQLQHQQPSSNAAAAAAAAAATTAAGGAGFRRISTGCAALDALLGGGGVACGSVTEFFGVPGVGKTQVGMQLAVNVQLPPALGGLGAKALYIDTEGSFMTDRVIDMAAAAVQQVTQTAAAAAAAGGGGGGDQPAAEKAQPFTVEAILSDILYFRVQHHTQQLALVRALDLLLQQQQVALIVIDSITFHFRQDFPDAAQRSRLMTRMAQQLAAVAEQHNVAVVMMNQVVTRLADNTPNAAAAASITSSSSGGGSPAAWLAPALGEGWGQAASTRVALFWEGPQRYALLAKAKEIPIILPQQQQQQLGWDLQHGQRRLCMPYDVTVLGVS